jgi:hypothetical protein
MPPERKFGMDEVMVDTLATFKAEKSRGLIHTPEWEAKMAHYQKVFDWHTQVFMGTDPRTLGPPPPNIYLPPGREWRGIGKVPPRDKLGTTTDPAWPFGPTTTFVIVCVASFLAGGLLNMFVLNWGTG